MLMPVVSIPAIVQRYRLKISLTLILVVLESGLGVLYPLTIGFAIDRLIDGSHLGIRYLIALGIASVIIGSARRLYDSRVYAAIYEEVVIEVLEAEREKKSGISVEVARANLLTEFVDFFEDAMPEVVGAIVSLVGILLVVATLNFPVFAACVALFSLVALVYIFSARLNFRLNTGYNDELEKQVDAIERRNSRRLKNHFRQLMSWNIKLSDLETFNYFIIWLGAVALFVSTPVLLISGGVLEYGLILAIMLYVFEFIDALVELPLHIQQVIRLQEISQRLKR
jgi:hypothetical protein